MTATPARSEFTATRSNPFFTKASKDYYACLLTMQHCDRTKSRPTGSRLVANLMRLGDSGVPREHEEAADISLSLDRLDSYVEISHLDLIARAIPQPDLLGDGHVAGTEALFDELQKLGALDPSQSRAKGRTDERRFRSRGDRRERRAIRETRNVIGTESRKDRERRFREQVQKVQIEAARVRTTRQRSLRQGGSIRSVEQCEQSRDDALDIVGADSELEGDLLVGQSASHSSEYFALALG
jgi:hypothetical protein